MIDLWNIKLMDSLIFIAAFLFGLQVGLGTAVSTWMVYGFLNPYGQDDPVLLAFLISGECFYAISGALLSRATIAKDLMRISQHQIPNGKLLANSTDPQSLQEMSGLVSNGIFGTLRNRLAKLYGFLMPYGKLSLFFGLIGFQATFAYDVLTNFGSWVFKTTSLYQAFLIGIITGVPFAILHETSNLVFFATVVPLGIVTARRLGLAGSQKSQ